MTDQPDAARQVATTLHEINARLDRIEQMLALIAERQRGEGETLHLLGNPANAQHLLNSIAQADRGQLIEAELAAPGLLPDEVAKAVERSRASGEDAGRPARTL